jgi:c(7)-type cytochrome triheme protein
MKRDSWIYLVVVLAVLTFLGFTVSGVQAKKVGGGDITYTPKGADPVTFSHEAHAKMKCNECHTKIFKMKKGNLKMNKEDHAKQTGCGVCHDGKKSFSQTAEADCAKCHKK